MELNQTRETKWMIITCIKDTGKTKIYELSPKDDHRIVLGHIQWFGRWRKYAFFPFSETVYETQCLTDIVNFLNELMDERKLSRLRGKMSPQENVDEQILNLRKEWERN